jgi:hypothetical protein
MLSVVAWITADGRNLAAFMIVILVVPLVLLRL